MSKFKRLGVLVVALALAAVPALAAASVSVGDFVQGLARAKNLGASDASAAVASLAGVGIRMPAGTDLGRPLTEADVASISRLAGVKVTTTRPDAPFDEQRLQRFFTTFANELGPKTGGETVSTRNGETPDGQSGDAPGNGPGFDPYSKGKGGSKGKKKGHRTPSDPE